MQRKSGEFWNCAVDKVVISSNVAFSLSHLLLSGANDYSSLIRESSVNVLDILEAFPSCMPSLQTLLSTRAFVFFTGT